MDNVMLLQRGSWLPISCTEWSYTNVPAGGGESIRHFISGKVPPLSDVDWARMARAISSCCPAVQACVGPVLIGGPTRGQGERLPGMVLVALVDAANPLETVFHECFHEAMDYLDPFDEIPILQEYAVEFRACAVGQTLESIDGDEGLAMPFARWAVGHPDIASPPLGVLAIWRAIKSSKVGSRRRASN